MRNTFRGYYPPTEAELEKLWSGGLIVLDTNALLNILRYSAETRDELLELLRNEKNRVWIPYQVGLEFHRNRRKMPGQTKKAFADVEAALTSARGGVETALRELGRHAHLEADELGKELKKHEKKLAKSLASARKKHDRAVTDDKAHTATFNAISDVFEGRVGEPYSEGELKAIYKDGDERFAKKIPPGFADAKKEGDGKYGDLVIWRQILDYAADQKKPMIFITDDTKEDWWEREGGKTIGPRPELVEEYYAATGGERVHFYKMRRYLAYAKERGANVSDALVEEASKVSSQAPSGAESTMNAVRLTKLLAQANEIIGRSPSLAVFSEQQARLGEQLSANVFKSKLLQDWPQFNGLNGVAAAQFDIARRAAEQSLTARTALEEMQRSADVYQRYLAMKEEENRRLRELGVIDSDEDAEEDVEDSNERDEEGD